MSDLTLRLSELNISRRQVRILWLIEFVPILEFFLKNGQIWPALLQS